MPVSAHTPSCALTCAKVVFDDVHDGVDDVDDDDNACVADDDDKASIADGDDDDADLFSGVCTKATLAQKSEKWHFLLKSG